MKSPRLDRKDAVFDHRSLIVDHCIPEMALVLISIVIFATAALQENDPGKTRRKADCKKRSHRRGWLPM